MCSRDYLTVRYAAGGAKKMFKTTCLWKNDGDLWGVEVDPETIDLKKTYSWTQRLGPLKCRQGASAFGFWKFRTYGDHVRAAPFQTIVVATHLISDWVAFDEDLRNAKILLNKIPRTLKQKRVQKLPVSLINARWTWLTSHDRSANWLPRSGWQISRPPAWRSPVLFLPQQLQFVEKKCVFLF